MFISTKRILLVLLVLLILVIAITPYIFGLRAEKAYNTWIDKWTEATNLKLISRRYDRGWFSSKAETVFQVSGVGKKFFDIIGNDTIIHGPLNLEHLIRGKFSNHLFPAHISSELRIAPPKQSEHVEIFKLLPPLVIETSLGFNGSGDSTISMLPFTYGHEQGGESIVWQGLNGRASFYHNFDNFSLDSNFPGILISDDNFSFSIHRLNFDMDLINKYEEFYVPEGDTNVAVDSIEIHGNDSEDGGIESLIIDKLNLSSSSSIIDGNINGTQRITIEGININDSQKYGPGSFEFVMRNIDAQAMRDFNASIEGIQEDEIDDRQKSQILMGKIMESIPNLLAKSPEFEVAKLRLKTDDGELIGSARVKIGSESPELLVNPLFLLSAVDAEAKVSIPEGLFVSIVSKIQKDKIVNNFEQGSGEKPSEDELNILTKSAASEMIKSLINREIFILKNKQYVFDASYKNGQFMLNGKPIQIPFVLQ